MESINGQVTDMQRTCGTVVSAIETLSHIDLQYWLQRFVLEVRKKDGAEFPPITLHRDLQRLMRLLRQSGKHSLDLFKDAEFGLFRVTGCRNEATSKQRVGLGVLIV